MKKFIEFIKRSIENKNLFRIAIIFSLFFGLVPTMSAYSLVEPTTLYKISFFISAFFFPCVWVLIDWSPLRGRERAIVMIILVCVITIFGGMICTLAQSFFWIFLIPFGILMFLAIIYVRFLDKRKEEEENEEFRLFQIKEFEEIEAKKKEKAKLNLVYASFLVDCGVILDSAQVVELNVALKEILNVKEENDSERVALLLHGISKSIPPSLKPSVAAIIAEKWLELENSEEGKQYSIEDLYSSVINE